MKEAGTAAGGDGVKELNLWEVNGDHVLQDVPAEQKQLGWG